MKVLVTGGTGTLGSAFVDAALDDGHAVRILSRRRRPSDRSAEIEWARADLASGRGVPPAVDGVDAVLHAATSPGSGAKEVDVQGTLRLVEAAEMAGVEHFIYPSIVGIDEIPLGYYQHKMAAEQVVTGGAVPHTILRATQFHAFIDRMIAPAMRLPFAVLLPTDFQVQSVAATEVAARLCDCLGEGPAGRLPDFAGPELHDLGEMARIWMEVRRQRKHIIHLPLPGKTARGFREGRNTSPDRREGTITWRVWLEGQ